MKFEVGEVCEAWCHPNKRHLVGGAEWAEVVLLDYSRDVDMFELDVKDPHQKNGFRNLWTNERNLRKKRPPADYIPLEVRDLFKIGETA